MYGIKISYYELTYKLRNNTNLDLFKNFASIKDAREWMWEHKEEIWYGLWSGHYPVSEIEYKWLNREEIVDYKGARDYFKNDPIGEGLFAVYTDENGDKWATRLGWLRSAHKTIVGEILNTCVVNNL